MTTRGTNLLGVPNEPENRLTVHLDTSVQIEQQKGEVKAGRVRRALSKYVFSSTSTYARKEFKRAWLKDLALIYRLCDGCKSISELYEKVRKSTTHPAVRRRRERCLEAMHAFLSTLDAEGVTLAGAVPMIQAHLGEAILGGYTKWDRSVTHQYDGTGCIRSAERPIRASNGAIDVTVRECTPKRVQCRVHHFFQKNARYFQKIADGVTSESSSELQSTKRAIDAAVKDPVSLCDSHNCSAMSDALIAVDGIAADHFAANNDKDWLPISQALGKPLVNPVRVIIGADQHSRPK